MPAQAAAAPQLRWQLLPTPCCSFGYYGNDGCCCSCEQLQAMLPLACLEAQLAGRSGSNYLEQLPRAAATAAAAAAAPPPPAAAIVAVGWLQQRGGSSSCCYAARQAPADAPALP